MRQHKDFQQIWDSSKNRRISGGFLGDLKVQEVSTEWYLLGYETHYRAEFIEIVPLEEMGGGGLKIWTV